MSDYVSMTPQEWTDLADDLEREDGGAVWAEWHRAMADVQTAIDLSGRDALDGLWPEEQVDAMERRLEVALARLRAAAIAGTRAMSG